MNRFGLWVIGAVAALGLLAVACGGDSTNDAAPGDASSGGGVVSPGGGMIAQNTFLEFEGRRYQLVNMFQADLSGDAVFVQAGSTKEADIDFDGELVIYQRSGDSQAIYTKSSGSDGGPLFWLQWRPVA